MGKISNYARVLKAKLQDVFVIDTTDSNVTSTKSVTVEQIGDAICGEQVHATLETDDQTIIGGINENKDKVGDLTTLTTTDKSSIVGAVNEVNSYKSGDTITFNFQQLFCRIDASGKRISVFIPLNKKIPSTATVTASGNYSVYYYDGSSLLSNHDIANDTQSIQNTPIGIVLTITLTNALSQTLGYGAVELRNTFTLTFS